jgi:predicted ATP-binding protein involved in virulence
MLNLSTEAEAEAGWTTLSDERIGISSISLQRYRCFNDIRVEFDPHITVISAPNGQGKTAILDALSISLRLFVDKLQKKSSSKGFAKDDIQLSIKPGGTMENFLPDEPTSFIAEGWFWGDKISWARELRSSNPRAKTRITEAKKLSELAKGLLAYLVLTQADGKNAGLGSPVMPLVGYYGTGRLFAQIKATKGKRIGNSRLDGYEDCLNPNSSYKSFLTWYERLSREAQAENETALDAGHKAKERLSVVNKAIKTVMETTGWLGIRWDYINSELLGFHSDGRVLPVRLLSDGIRNIFAMVADMAFRCAQINPHLGGEAAAKTPGVVLVDEIEMHLHPEWQQVILGQLMTAFPLVQLIVTTHSPQIVTTVKGKSIRILNNGGVFAPSVSPYGHEAGMALPSVFDVPQRPPIDEVTSELGRYFELIRSASYSEEAAEEIIDSLTKMGYELSSAEERRAALLLKHFNNSRIVGS